MKMANIRQTAIEIQQDIIAKKKTKDIVKLLDGKTKEDIEQICSFPVDGRNVFQTIAANDKASVLKHILEQGVEISGVDPWALHVAVSHKAKKTTKLLLENGAKLDTTGHDGKTPLHIAAENGHVDIMKILLESAEGKEVMKIQEAVSGCTPLSLACMTGQEAAAILLIENKAEINIKTGYPPLHAAAFVGNINIVNNLIKKGADVHLQDGFEETPLHYAAYKGQRKCVRALLEAGAKTDVIDRNGKTPLDLTKSNEVKKIIEAYKKREN